MSMKGAKKEFEGRKERGRSEELATKKLRRKRDESPQATAYPTSPGLISKISPHLLAEQLSGRLGD